MSRKEANRIVYKETNGKWVNKRNGAGRPSSWHDTQKAAIDRAREQLKSEGGGELTIMGLNGQIRGKDTIAPGKCPFPPKG